MKQLYSSVILVFYLQYGFGQIQLDSELLLNSDDISVFDQRDIVTADIDGDGDLDLITASVGSNRLCWFENYNGQGGLTVPRIISEDTGSPISIFVIDIDDDGDLDVITSFSEDDKIVWYENIDGLGEFGNQQIVTTLTDGANNVAAADLDGDGDIDVLSSSFYDDKIAWYENIDGQGSFGEQIIISQLTNQPKDVKAVDIDADGDFDVISNGMLFENIDGLANFQGHEIMSPYYGKIMDTGDIDGDGDLDIFAMYDAGIRWYENIDGQVSFDFGGSIAYYQYVYQRPLYDFRLVDFDDDGDIDVSFTRTDHVEVYENIDGQGDFEEFQMFSYNTSEELKSVDLADIDNDGDEDILAISSDGINIHYYNDNDFDNREIYSYTFSLNTVLAADMDNDGDKDLIVSNSLNFGAVLWLENVNGEFENYHHVSDVCNGCTTIKAVDIDNDSDLDIVTASTQDGWITLYKNLDGQGTFDTGQILFYNGTGSVTVRIIDIDGNSYMDILTSSSERDEIVISKNGDGTGANFTETLITSTGNNIASIFAEDLDSDGDKDIILATEIENTIKWHENIDGQGTFEDSQDILIDANEVQDIYVADLDNDGDNDIIVAALSDDQIYWIENIDESEDFGSEQIVAEIDSPTALFIFDIDSDGDMDIMYRAANSIHDLWFENLNLGESFVEKSFSGNSTFDQKVDFDNDGDFDFISANSGDIFLNRNLGTSLNKISGFVKNDLNANDCDDVDLNSGNIMIVGQSSGETFATFSLTSGFYQLDVGEGDIVTQVENLPNYFLSNPLSYNSNFEGYGNEDVVDFCIEPIGVINDLNITIYPSIDDPRPGFDTTYQLVYKNVGTTQMSGNVAFEFDDSKLEFISASENVSIETANTLTFDFVELDLFETRTIDLEFNVFAPPMTEIGDVLVSTATINPVSGDETENDNVFEFQQTVIGSYDPNDIICLEGDQILIVDADKYLHYLIRFQNTGTASAINVRVENVIDDKLDWTTMQLESLSHDGRVEILNGSDVSFIFDNINLSDSTNDEPNSHGFIAYKIKPRSDVQLGDVFENTADIYFDFNPPIITNTYETEIVDALSVSEFNDNIFTVYPNPTHSKLKIHSAVGMNEISVVDNNGRLLMTLDNLGFIKDVSLDVEKLSNGIYFLNIRAENREQVIRFIKN